MNSCETLSRAQLHIHTKEGDGLVSIEEVLLTAQNLGLKIIAITDHDQIESSRKAKNLACQKNLPVVILEGIEITASLSFEHILAIFPEGVPDFGKEYMFMGLRKTVDWIHEKNGLAIFAHPWTSPSFLRDHQIAKIFDGIEIVSPVERLIRKKFKSLNGQVAFLRGGDIHLKNDKGWCYLTLFPGTTVDDLLKAIKDKQTIPKIEDFGFSRPSFKEVYLQVLKALLIDPFQTGRLIAFKNALVREALANIQKK